MDICGKKSCVLQPVVFHAEKDLHNMLKNVQSCILLKFRFLGII